MTLTISLYFLSLRTKTKNSLSCFFYLIFFYHKLDRWRAIFGTTLGGPCYCCYLESSAEQHLATGNHLSTITLSAFDFRISYNPTIGVVNRKSTPNMTQLDLMVSKSYNGDRGNWEGLREFPLLPEHQARVNKAIGSGEDYRDVP